MPFFDHYPYTNLHNVNLDWVLQKVKEWGAMVEDNNQRFEDLQTAYEAFRDWLTNDYNNFKDYVTSYLENLDVQEEINNKLEAMLRSGELVPYLQPYISNTVADWMEEHITPTTPSIDTSLTVRGAAADAYYTGLRIQEALDGAVHDIEQGYKSVPLTLVQGTFGPDGIALVPSVWRVRENAFIPVKPNNRIELRIVSQYMIYNSCWFYDADHNVVRRGEWKEERVYITPENCYFIRVTLCRDIPATTNQIVPSDIDSAIFDIGMLGDIVEVGVNNLYTTNTYAKYNILDRTPLTYTKLAGRLKYLQAFCIYDNKYYSTDGSNIAVQNLDFTEIQTAELSVGHGNSMQIGQKYSNHAYVSGWDDNTIYIVNLDDLTIVDTISLPTTGYTTVAVDDVNGIAYIFQRDTNPVTDEYYTFIVYNYINDEILRTRKTLRQFAAMQACDFIEDKIIVINGSAQPTINNYYIIYDTDGNMVEELKLPFLDEIEPEGVYIDRTAQSYILISTYARDVYRIVSRL